MRAYGRVRHHLGAVPGGLRQSPGQAREDRLANHGRGKLRELQEVDDQEKHRAK